MFSRRIIVLTVLMALPFVVCGAFGAHAIWVTGYWKTLWVVVPVCWLLAWAVARCWPPLDTATLDTAWPAPGHWSPRDEEAAKIVQRRQAAFTKLDRSKLVDPHHYVNEIQQLASELSSHYERRKASGPTKGSSPHQHTIEDLTLVEIAAAARLAIDDIETFLINTVPGSRLLTLKQWQAVTSIPQWCSVVSKIYWATSIALNPANVLRYGSSKAMLDPVKSQIQTEVVATIYMRFIRQVGFYLIEMNSGRLRGGAEVYLETFAVTQNESKSPVRLESQHESERAAVAIKLVVIGQTGAGKSSLVQALMRTGESSSANGSEANWDESLPTKKMSVHHWNANNSGATVTLVDTPGYGESDISSRKFARHKKELTSADVVVLVVNAQQSARQADQAALDSLYQHYENNPKLHPPKILVVVTHVDRLPPVDAWQPDYSLDWPETAKEQAIVNALEKTRDVFGQRVEQVVPVCVSSDRRRHWAVDRHVIPALICQLDEGRSIALIRKFEKRIDLGRLSQLLTQTGKLTSTSVKAWFQERLRKRR